MAILTRDIIKEAIEKGEIKIDPMNEKMIGPGSVDLTLGNDFRIFKASQEVYSIKDDSNFHDVTEEVHIEDGQSIIIQPGQMILGVTKEKITLAEDIAGWLQGRSRFARFGLAIHVTASFMQPGISNQQVLEIVNLSQTPMALYPGTVICQFIFEKCLGCAKYEGTFSQQNKP